MRRSVAVAVLTGLVGWGALGAEPDLPSVTFTNKPGNEVRWLNGTSTRWYEGTYMSATNCRVLKSAGTAQDLTGLAVTVRVGTVIWSTAVATSGSASQRSNGLYHFTLPVGTNTSSDQIIIQTTIYGETTSVIEPWHRAYTEEPLD